MPDIVLSPRVSTVAMSLVLKMPAPLWLTIRLLPTVRRHPVGGAEMKIPRMPLPAISESVTETSPTPNALGPYISTPSIELPERFTRAASTIVVPPMPCAATSIPL